MSIDCIALGTYGSSLISNIEGETPHLELRVLFNDLCLVGRELSCCVGYLPLNLVFKIVFLMLIKYVSIWLLHTPLVLVIPLQIFSAITT